ncbi:PLP-dependent aminotransferase family protein, partial [Corynebacterium striatum]
MATLAPERTWYVNGFSKSLSPGLRVGALVPPERQHARADVILQATTLAVSPLMAELVTRWIQDGTAGNIATAL